jgi:hypothetical protein
MQGIDMARAWGMFIVGDATVRGGSDGCGFDFSRLIRMKKDSDQWHKIKALRRLEIDSAWDWMANLILSWVLSVCTILKSKKRMESSWKVMRGEWRAYLVADAFGTGRARGSLTETQKRPRGLLFQ